MITLSTVKGKPVELQRGDTLRYGLDRDTQRTMGISIYRGSIPLKLGMRDNPSVFMPLNLGPNGEGSLKEFSNFAEILADMADLKLEAFRRHEANGEWRVRFK